MDIICETFWVNLTPYLFPTMCRPIHALFGLFPLEHIAWQQEDAPRQGPFMSEAIIFEWTSAPPPAKHKHLTIEGNTLKRLKHATVRDTLSGITTLSSLSSSRIC